MVMRKILSLGYFPIIAGCSFVCGLGLLLIVGTQNMSLALLGASSLLMLGSMVLALAYNVRRHTDMIEREVLAVRSAMALHWVPINRLASFSRHAAAPDLIELVCEFIRRTSACRVLELGCGTSSLYITAILANFKGKTQLVCLEDSQAWTELVQSEIDGLLNELDGVVDAHIIYAPLVPSGVTQKPFYELTGSELLRSGTFDLLLIDGPGEAGLRANAWPLLKHLLSVDSVVIIDDGNLVEIQRAVRAWQMADPAWQTRYYPTVKGTWVMWNRGHTWSLPLP
jgi:SAM-dependent methyltransferase